MGSMTNTVAAEDSTEFRMKFATRNMTTVHQGLLRERLFVKNQTAIRLAAPLLVSVAASIMQKTRKTAVLLPKVACVTLAAVRPGTVMRAKTIIMLGQPVPQVRKRMMAPTRIPRTWKPA